MRSKTSVPLHPWVSAYLDSLRLGEATLRNYGDEITKFIEWFYVCRPESGLSELKSADVVQYCQYLEIVKHEKPRSTRHKLDLLQRFCRSAGKRAAQQPKKDAAEAARKLEEETVAAARRVLVTKDTLTVNEAVVLFEVPKSKIYSLIKAGTLAATMVPETKVSSKYWIVDRQALATLLARPTRAEIALRIRLEKEAAKRAEVQADQEVTAMASRAGRAADLSTLLPLWRRFRKIAESDYIDLTRQSGKRPDLDTWTEACLTLCVFRTKEWEELSQEQRLDFALAYCSILEKQAKERGAIEKKMMTERELKNAKRYLKANRALLDDLADKDFVGPLSAKDPLGHLGLTESEFRRYF